MLTIHLFDVTQISTDYNTTMANDFHAPYFAQKNRGKRKIGSSQGLGQKEETASPKRAKKEENLKSLDPKVNAYLKEMQSYNSRSVGDERSGRPLVK